MWEYRYLNGQQKGGASSGSGKNSEKYLNFREPVYLGAGNNRGKAEGFYHGLIDEVRLYNRPLTEDEILQNYQANAKLGIDPVEKLPITWGTLKTKP